ncbi:unnamed protein product, partial [Prorocentrum cordatum]
EQLERCRSGGREGGGGEALAVYKDLCNRDAVYTWNVLIERINQAAHWREEFRELRDADETDSEGSDLDMGAEPPDIQEMGCPLNATQRTLVVCILPKAWIEYRHTAEP